MASKDSGTMDESEEAGLAMEVEDMEVSSIDKASSKDMSTSKTTKTKMTFAVPSTSKENNKDSPKTSKRKVNDAETSMNDSDRDRSDDSDNDFDDEIEIDEEDNDEDEEDDTGETEYNTSPTKGSKSAGKVHDGVFTSFSFADQAREDDGKEECVKNLSAESERWVPRDACNTAHVKISPEFVCVQYPAVVKNTKRALECIGGFEEIDMAKESSKIDFRFRPEDPYCKPTCGQYKKNNHLLVKCMRRKKKFSPTSSSTSPLPSSSTSSLPSSSSTSSSNPIDPKDDGFEYKMEVIGMVNGILSFPLPCDYQYLPVENKPDGSGYTELISRIVIKFEDEREDFMNRDVPLYLPPYVFSRTEKLAKYFFQDDIEKEGDYIGIARKMRPQGTQRSDFDTAVIPSKPNDNAKASFEICKLTLDPLHQLFQERPMWSKVALSSKLKRMGFYKLKSHINMVAYYIASGPWKHMWCRFNYDPRLHPESKMLQTIDFRIRKPWNREKVTAKRSADHFLTQKRRMGSNSIKGHRLPPHGPAGQLASSDSLPSKSTSMDNKDEEEIDIHYQYVPDKIPPHRQVFFQVCDVFDDKVQELVHSNDGKEDKCTEKDGWCVPDFTDLARNILTENVEKLFDHLLSREGEGDELPGYEIP